MRKIWIPAVVALMAMGQQKPPAATPSTTMPKYTMNSNLVIVDLTVKDKNGKAIEGLTKNDVEVLEDGKPQTIAFFEPQKLTLDPEPPEPPPSLEDKNALPDPPKTTITSAGKDKIQYHDKRLIALFFDFSNMQIPEQLRAQDAALKFLNEQITSSDLVAVLLFTSVVSVRTDFTADRSVLTDIIKGLPIGDSSENAALADDASDNGEDTGAAFVADETEFNIFNTDLKLAALEQVVRQLATLPEKKALVYVTGGISKSGSLENQAQLEASINAAVKSNVAIFPIDARGLMADPPGGAASTASSRGGMSLSTYNNQRATVNDSQETLVTLAADTGGKAFLDSNDLSLGLKQVQEQYASYYILGYNTPNNTMDGKFRKITVRLKDPIPGAKLDFRNGYFADKLWKNFNGDDKERQLKDALMSENPVTDIPLAVEVDYFRISPTAYFVPVSVKIPGSVIALAQKKAVGETEFDFIGNVMDERKQVQGMVRDFIHIKLPTTEAEKVSSRNFHYDAGFTLSPGRYRMRFLVREGQSGKMGTFDTRFVIPDLAADSMTLKTSSIVWSSQREALKAAVGQAEQITKKNAAANPLISGDEKVVPNVGDYKVFRRGQNMYIDFDVYDAAPDPKNAAARAIGVEMSLFNQKGDKTFEVGPVKATELVSTRPDAVPVRIQIPLKNVAPGRYVCQLNVIDEIGRKFAFPRASVVIQ
jgi:VWFA-related protein